MGVLNILFDNLAQTRAPPKHYKTGVSVNMHHETAILDPKKPNPEIPVMFFVLLLSLSTTKNTNMLWNPYFYSHLAKSEKENFQKFNSKHRKLKTRFLHPFFEKGYFLKIARELAKKQKHKMITGCATTIKIDKNRLGPWANLYLAPELTFKRPNLAPELTSRTNQSNEKCSSAFFAKHAM